MFVGLCRTVGLPARDVYGLRVAPSAFGYRELGGNPASLKGAQHCRAEVFLKGQGWEGNWMAYNTAHDVSLPHSKGPKLGFFMYPTAENDSGRLDSYAPDDFKYQISAKEIKV